MTTALISMAVLIMIYAILNAAGTAIVAVSDNQVESDAEEGNKRAKRVLSYQENEKLFTVTIHMILTLIILINGGIALDTFQNDVRLWLNADNNVYLNIISFIIISVILLIIHMVFGHLIPKRLANKYPSRVLYQTIGFVSFFIQLFRPLYWVNNYLSIVFGRLFGLHPNEGDRKVTEEEIMTIVEASSKTGDIDEEESEMIQNIFEFGDTTVDEVMTHRTEVSAISVKSTKKQVIDYIRTEQFTRFPVYDGDIDHIIGTMHVKDLLRYIDNPEEKFSVKSLLRPPYFVPDSKRTSELFREMQKQKNHIAIVLDEYGGTAGIVTIEDLIEEIVGNIFDEYDDEEEEIQIVDHQTFEVDGLSNISDVEDIIDAGLPVDDYDTVSGFILGQLGRFPEENEEVVIVYEGFKFEVLSIEDKVISRVRITKPSDDRDKDEDNV
ncbi:MAG: hemolysin family protein [Acholeplasmataceae bacterium]|jgi:putative hemolysin|nr:hemolysin family protein [Acholeplasmataceae bacterium]MDD4194356.1 hemolysin family protein [Acholeplasmataceae bacterium]